MPTSEYAETNVTLSVSYYISGPHSSREAAFLCIDCSLRSWTSLHHVDRKVTKELTCPYVNKKYWRHSTQTSKRINHNQSTYSTSIRLYSKSRTFWHVQCTFVYIRSGRSVNKGTIHKLTWYLPTHTKPSLVLVAWNWVIPFNGHTPPTDDINLRPPYDNS